MAITDQDFANYQRDNSASPYDQVVPAHEALARLINDELRVIICDCGCVRVAVEPQELRHFIRNNWERIARYAHLIHRGK